MTGTVRRMTAALAMTGLVAGLAGSASAQDYSRDYQNNQYDQNSQYNPDYPDVAPPGYDGRDLPPPPPGWRQPSDWSYRQQQNERYAQAAEGWARDNCVRSQSNAGVGAVIGGVIGAVIGNSVAGRHDKTFGTLAGAAVGAAGGAAVGSTTGGRTSPGCPPGFVLRSGSRPYDYSASGYTYAAPSWYKPWVNSDGNWNYRPYPYGQYYYSTYVARTSRPDNYGNQPGYRQPSGWYDRQGRYRSNDGSWYDRDGVFHMGPGR